MTKKTSFWQRLKNAFTDTDNSSSTAQKPSSEPSEHPLFPQNLAQQDLTGQVIVDLTQQADNLTPEKDFVTQFVEECLISANDIEQLLTSMGYHFSYHPPKLRKSAEEPNVTESSIHHFTMQISDGQVSDGEKEWGCLLRFFEKEQLLAVYSIFPFSVPETHRGEMVSVLTYLNYDLVIGCKIASVIHTNSHKA